MKRTRTLFTIAGCCLLYSCTHEPPTPPSDIIALVDFSPSRDTAVLSWYREVIIHSVLDKMGPKDRLIVLPIDYNSQTSGEELYKIDFAKNDYTSEFGGLQKDEMERQAHMQAVQSAEQQFGPIFETARHKRTALKDGTDIFGGLSQALKYVLPGKRNIVIVMSDMIVCTDKTTWNFESHLNSPDQIGHYLAIAPKMEMQGVHVLVLCGAQNDAQPDKFNTVKAFWEQYLVDSCHAQLADYSAGAVTQLEQLLAK